MTTKTDDQERTLLPCPFCGGEPSISKQMGESIWSHNIVLWTGVQCDECEAQVGPTCEGYEVEAVDMWNRRAALQSQDREGADLKEALLLALEYWTDRQQRYKNRSPVWVQKARAALGIDHARRVEGES